MKFKEFALLIISLAMLGGVAIPIVRSLTLVQTRQQSSGTQIVISMAGFQPQAITIPANQTVPLEFINPDTSAHRDGGGWHQWENSKLGINVLIPPQTAKKVSVLFTKRGTYDFVCTVCCGGAGDPAMHEQVTVI